MKKKLLRLLGCIVFCVLVLLGTEIDAKADELDSSGTSTWLSDYDYDLCTYDGTIAIKGYHGSEKEITIPAKGTVDGVEYTVTLMGWSTRTTTNGSMDNRWGTTLETIRVEDGFRLRNTAECAFYNATSLKEIYLDNATVEDGTTFSYMFYDCTNLMKVKLGSITGVDKLVATFCGCESLTSVDAQNWNLSKCTDIAQIFEGCKSLTSLDVSKWNTAKITRIYYAFSCCYALEKLDISGWNTSNMKSMTAAFQGCKKLKELDVSGWDTSKCTNMGHLFEDCSALTSLDVSKWDVSNVTLTNYMFSGCHNLLCLDLSSWDFSKIKYADDMVNEGFIYTLKTPKNLQVESKTATVMYDMATGDSYKALPMNSSKSITLTRCAVVYYDETKTNIVHTEPLLLWSEPTYTNANYDMWCTYSGTGYEEADFSKIYNTVKVFGHKHTWGSWETVTAATYTSTGIKRHTCTACGRSEECVIPQLVKPTVTTSRLGGATRFETATACADALGSRFNAFVLVNAYNFPDALAGCSFATGKNAPILMVSATDESANSVTYNYINTHANAGATIYLLGGNSAVSSTTENTLRAAGYQVVRLGGATRYETNMNIVNAMSIPTGTNVIIASGTNFADSLSISGIAGAEGWPVFLAGESLTNEQIAKIAAIRPNKIYIVGGEAAVSANVANSVASYGSVTRISGATRYETSLEIAKNFAGLCDGNAYIAYGANFPDALAGSVVAASHGAPIILVDNANVSTQAAYVDSANLTALHALGGNAVVSDEVMNTLAQ